MTLILQGVVGSMAYGLAREGSDVDLLGVFVAPTVQVAGLDWSPRRESRVTVTVGPDSCAHEVGKFLRLALQCNPTLLELLWLPADGLTVSDEWGHDLRRLRTAVLSERAVRAAYGGYARQQAGKLAARDGQSFSSETKNRTVKHARHLLRLLRQGRELLEAGALSVHVGDPADYFAFDSMSVGGMLEVYAREDALFGAARSVLPAEPDRVSVRRYLDRVRRTHLG